MFHSTAPAIMTFNDIQGNLAIQYFARTRFVIEEVRVVFIYIIDNFTVTYR